MLVRMLPPAAPLFSQEALPVVRSPHPRSRGYNAKSLNLVVLKDWCRWNCMVRVSCYDAHSNRHELVRFSKTLITTQTCFVWHSSLITFHLGKKFNHLFSEYNTLFEGFRQDTLGHKLRTMHHVSNSQRRKQCLPLPSFSFGLNSNSFSQKTRVFSKNKTHAPFVPCARGWGRSRRCRGLRGARSRSARGGTSRGNVPWSRKLSLSLQLDRELPPLRGWNMRDYIPHTRLYNTREVT